MRSHNVALQCSLNEGETKYFKNKWNYVKMAMTAAGSANSCAYCHSSNWMQEIIAAAEQISPEDPIVEMRQKLAGIRAGRTRM